MTRRLPLLVGALAFASAIGTAEAGHAHFSGGFHFSGGAHWGGGVHVSGGAHWASPAYRPSYWGVSGHIYVGGYRPYYYRPYYYYYYPEYVPTYYSASYYPVEAGYAAPGVTTVVAPHPELPKFGIGLFAGGVNVQDQYGQSVPDSSDVGVLGRIRLTTGLILEGELGKTSYNVDGNNNLRVDRRLGGSLLYEIGAYNRFAPYLLVGMGVQQADVNGGDYTTTQDFAEVGAGLRFAITPHFHIAADIRLGSRSTVAQDAMPLPATDAGATTAVRTVTPPSTSSGNTEDYTRGRLSAILYF